MGSTAHPSTVNVPITALLCNGPLLCGSNVPVKGLNGDQRQSTGSGSALDAVCVDALYKSTFTLLCFLYKGEEGEVWGGVISGEYILSKKRKVKVSKCIFIALIFVAQAVRSGMNHTILPATIHQCLPLPRKRLPDGASTY